MGQANHQKPKVQLYSLLCFNLAVNPNFTVIAGKQNKLAVMCANIVTGGINFTPGYAFVFTDVGARSTR